MWGWRKSPFTLYGGIMGKVLLLVIFLSIFSIMDAKVSKPFVEGIYLTAYTVSSSTFEKVLDSAQAAGINTVIFDVKNMNGSVFASGAEISHLSAENYHPILFLPDVVKTLHDRDMKAVSRVVMFHDSYLARADSTLRPKMGDSLWVESKKKGASWVDSSNPEVQSRLLKLIEFVAKSGVDEIQLDYIRFPTQGMADRASFYFQREDSLRLAADSLYVMREKKNIIMDFVKRAAEICKKYDVDLAGDLFAIVSWQRKVDVSKTGQDIGLLSDYFNAIHPMIYSSHFNENFGFRRKVNNEVYHITYTGSRLARKYAQASCRVIPYIQANGWRVNYTREYMRNQIQAVKDAGCSGYILWNSSNNYTTTLEWIRDLRK